MVPETGIEPVRPLFTKRRIFFTLRFSPPTEIVRALDYALTIALLL
jgi:hypothetical protein